MPCHTVDFDTGSSDLFVPSTTCGSTCAGHNAWNPSGSSTARNLEKSFTITYGGGENVIGGEYTDIVRIAGLTVRVMGFFSFFFLSFFSFLKILQKCLHFTIGELPDPWCCDPI